MTADKIDMEALAEVGRAYMEKRAAHLDRLESALRQGVPHPLVCSTLAPDFDPSAPAVVEADRWVASPLRGLQILFGKVGVGKSIGAARWAIATGALWVTASEVSTWQLDAAENARRWSSAPHLVIDEIGGQGSTSDRAVERIAAVLAARWSAARDTVGTTNLERETFARLLDDSSKEQSRLSDRLNERGAWCTITGPSRRSTPVDWRAGEARLERWRLAGRLSDRVAGCARGYDVDDGFVARFIELIGVKPEHIERARATLNNRARKNAEFAAPYLAQWESEIATARAEEAQTLAAMASMIRRHCETTPDAETEIESPDIEPKSERRGRRGRK